MSNPSHKFDAACVYGRTILIKVVQALVEKGLYNPKRGYTRIGDIFRAMEFNGRDNDLFRALDPDDWAYLKDLSKFIKSGVRRGTFTPLWHQINIVLPKDLLNKDRLKSILVGKLKIN